MRTLQAVTGLLLLLSTAVYGYSLTMDTSVTTSDQNLMQFWAGALLVLALAVGLVPLLIAAARRDRDAG